MQKIKSLLLSVAILTASGCSLASTADPQEVISEMITNMNALTALTFDVNANVQQNDTETETAVNADISIKGKTENTDQAIPNIELEISAIMDTQDAEKGNLNGDAALLITIKDSQVYFKLDSIALPAELQEQVESFVSLYQGNWYKFPNELLPADLQTQIEAQNENKAKIQKLVQEATLFDVITSSTAGDDYVYNTVINQENFKTLVQEIAKIQGEPMSETDLASLDESFDNYDHSIDLYINKSSKYLDKIEFTLTSKDATDNLQLTTSISLTNHNEAQNITAPADAQDFNLMGLMGLGMMLEGSQGTSLNEAPEDFEDLDLNEFENMTMEDLENMGNEIEETMEEFEENFEDDMEELGDNIEDMMEESGGNMTMEELSTMMEDLPTMEVTE